MVAGEVAAMRVPDIRALETIAAPLTVDRAADRWLASRRDVRERTRKTYDVALGRLRPRVGGTSSPTRMSGVGRRTACTS
jgi:hypothetical protein